MPSAAACESSDSKFLIQMLLLISSYKVNFRRNDIRELLFNYSVCDFFFSDFVLFGAVISENAFFF